MALSGGELAQQMLPPRALECFKLIQGKICCNWGAAGNILATGMTSFWFPTTPPTRTRKYLKLSPKHLSALRVDHFSPEKREFQFPFFLPLIQAANHLSRWFWGGYVMTRVEVSNCRKVVAIFHCKSSTTTGYLLPDYPCLLSVWCHRIFNLFYHTTLLGKIVLIHR